MSRRCKPGIRARFIDDVPDAGKIVLVVRHYFGEVVSGAHWPEPLFPWVVVSLSGPLRTFDVDTGKELLPEMTIVCDDCHLEPLRDDDEDDSESESRRADRFLRRIVRQSEQQNKELLP